MKIYTNTQDILETSEMNHDKDVFMIFDRKSNCPEGVYSRAYHDEFEFNSVSHARSSNCHDIYKDKNKYRIAKYHVTYRLINPDVLE